MLEKQNSIKIIHEPQTHKTLVVKNYKYTTTFSSHKIKKSLSSTWHIVESVINEEINWLKNKIPVMPEGYKNNPLFLSNDLVLRKIAILIVSGNVGVTEFLVEGNKDMWNNFAQALNLNKISRHGKEWHKKMMDTVCDYFRIKGSKKVVLEPVLYHGRADLGVFLNQRETLYIEIGTVSLYKLWYNLSSMKNITFLIIPSEEYAIEFKV